MSTHREPHNSDEPSELESLPLSDAVAETVKAGTEAEPVALISTIMKTKHDTVKNSISNVR